LPRGALLGLPCDSVVCVGVVCAGVVWIVVVSAGAPGVFLCVVACD
jgi:hypothetical protein